MNDPAIEAAAYPPSYPGSIPPTWPPPSGGAPFPGTELGPVLNPYPYGSPQPANISTAHPMPPFLATGFPDPIPPRNGQNQGPGFGLPPSTRPMEGGPRAADPMISAGHPPYIMGPGPQGTAPFERGPQAGHPVPGTTFPAGSYIDGLGTLITSQPVKIVGSGTSAP